MTGDVDFSFPHRFAWEVLDELPGGASPRYYFPRDRAAGQDGVVVRVWPEKGEGWVGTFAFGRFGTAGVTRVLSMPDADRLCVVARGAGYLVTAAEPSVWETVRATPIVDVREVAGAELVVFANFTELLAYGKEGVRWRTKRVAWDGFKIVAVGDQTIVGEYWDIREEAMQRFEVDVATGETRGGVVI